MRNFRYIEPGHGRKSMTKEETDNAYIYLDIRTEDYYALMPVTKEEFDLVNSVEKYNREFPGVFNKPSVEKQYKFEIGDKVAPDPKNEHIPGWKDRGVGKIVEQGRLYRNEENCYGIIWEGLSGPIYSFEDNLILAPEASVDPVVKTGTVQFCTSCNNVVHPDPYNNNYLTCGCIHTGQVDSHDMDNVPSWHPASVEIRMK